MQKSPTSLNWVSVRSAPLQHAGGDGVWRQNHDGPADVLIRIVQFFKKIFSFCLRQGLWIWQSVENKSIVCYDSHNTVRNFIPFLPLWRLMKDWDGHPLLALSHSWSKHKHLKHACMFRFWVLVFFYLQPSSSSDLLSLKWGRKRFHTPWVLDNMIRALSRKI